VALVLQESKKIVVSVWPGIGDVVFVTPLFRVLRKKFPTYWITTLTWSEGGKEVLKYNPYINEIIQANWWNLRKIIRKIRNYEIGIQCSHPVDWLFRIARIKIRLSFNGHPFWWLYPVGDNRLHAAEIYLQISEKIDGKKIKNEIKSEVFVSEKEINKAAEILEKLTHPIIIIHPGARCNKNKIWGIKKLVGLCSLLQKKFEPTFLLVGGKGDVKLSSYILSHLRAKFLNLTNKLSLLEFAALCKGSDLFIGNASGPTHIAGAMGIPVVAIYGPDAPQNFAPLGREVRVITPTNKCAPCFYFYRNFIWGLRLRYIPYCKGIKSITIEKVFDRCVELLEKNEKKEEKNE
jgi:heptosyltransferase-2